MPVVAVEHVRHESKPPATLDRRTREQQKASVLVGIRRIKGRTIEQLRTVDEVNGCRGVRIRRGPHRERILRIADCNPCMLQSEYRLQIRVRTPYGGVQRHECMHLVTPMREFSDQGADDVREPTGFRIGIDLRTQNAQLEGSHDASLTKPNSKPNSTAKKLVLCVAECGTLGVASRAAPSLLPPIRIGMRHAARTNTGRYVSRLTSGTLAVVMAGGRGERLKALTLHRCKPATPFGGKFRIIDFVLSNCVNSGIRQIAVLTQYKAQPLIQHIQRGWSYLRGELGEFVELIPAQQQIGAHWYRGTADSVYQNLEFIRSHNPTHVLILAGDHIYKMDYGPMIAYHEQCEADITVGVVDVPLDRAQEFGIMTTDDTNRVIKFAEKPQNPDPILGHDDLARASMGIYVIALDRLEKLLAEDAANENSKHDFGRNIIPPAIERLRVFAYPFHDVETRAQNYWRDVGNIDALYEANMELVALDPELNIYDHQWPIWTYQAQHPPAKFVLDEEGRRGMAVNSMVAGGCIISGAYVSQSLLSSDVRIEDGSIIDSSVLLPGVTIGRRCKILRCILDENCVIPDGLQIGHDAESDHKHFYVTKRGVVVVTPDMLRALP